MRSSSRVAGALGALAVLAFAASAAHAQPAGDAGKGADTFNEVCTQCHTLGAVAAGPDLIGVVGRKAGTSPDYPYTAGMKASGLTWTPANLERFLANPQATVPGTAMAGVSVASAADRANIVAYLAKQKAH